MPYCTLAQIKKKISTEGANLRLDDVDAGDDADILAEVDEKINEHCFGWYTEANLMASDWIRFAAVTIGVTLLCERRGNPAPASVQRQYQEYMGGEQKTGRLEQIRLGSFRIPGIPVREACVPTMSNQRPISRPYPRMVTETKKSTGTVTDYRQKKDYANLHDYLDYCI